MAIRDTMRDLISRVRDAISDVADSESGEIWTDQRIQDALDDNKAFVRQMPLTNVPEFGAGGVIVFKEFVAPSYTNWEEGVVIVDGSTYTTHTPETSDLRAGRWRFSTSFNQTMMVTGQVYDVNGAAADMLDKWAARLKGSFDTTDASGAQMRRKQKFDNVVALAATYRSKQSAKPSTVTRLDIARRYV